MNYFLDHASTTPLSDPMKAYLMSLLDLYGNPSSLHSIGTSAKQLLSEARRSVADFIHANSRDITFTPSGSAGNTLAIKGLTSDDPQVNQFAVFYSPTAHKSMQNACESCLCHTPLRVNAVGEIDVCYLDDLLTRHNGLKPVVCIEAANSEIGTIQDVCGIGSIVHRHHGIFVVDATGYLPSYPVDMRIWKHAVDILTFSGHKLHALKGVGVLWKRSDLTLKPLIYGTQEHGLIGGTENMLGIASLGKAAADYDYSSITSLNRDYVYDYVRKHIPGCYAVGASIESGNRLPHNLFLCFKGVDGESLMILLDMNGIQVSTGSACNSKNLSASAALTAIGMNEDDIHSCIRLTFSGRESQKELDYVCKTIKQCVLSLRELSAKSDENKRKEPHYGIF